MRKCLQNKKYWRAIKNNLGVSVDPASLCLQWEINLIILRCLQRKVVVAGAWNARYLMWMVENACVLAGPIRPEYKGTAVVNIGGLCLWLILVKGGGSQSCLGQWAQWSEVSTQVNGIDL